MGEVEEIKKMIDDALAKIRKIREENRPPVEVTDTLGEITLKVVNEIINDVDEMTEHGLMYEIYKENYYKDPKSLMRQVFCVLDQGGYVPEGEDPNTFYVRDIIDYESDPTKESLKEAAKHLTAFLEQHR